jgi:hypothetical protein
VHIVGGAALFLALAAAAFGLWEFTEWMRELGAPYWLLVICDLIAYLLCGVDVTCAAFFIAVEGFIFLRAVWKMLKQELDDE